MGAVRVTWPISYRGARHILGTGDAGRFKSGLKIVTDEHLRMDDRLSSKGTCHVTFQFLGKQHWYYLGNDTRQRHSYNGRLIGNYICDLSNGTNSNDLEGRWRSLLVSLTPILRKTWQLLPVNRTAHAAWGFNTVLCKLNDFSRSQRHRHWLKSYAWDEGADSSKVQRSKGRSPRPKRQTAGVVSWWGATIRISTS